MKVTRYKGKRGRDRKVEPRPGVTLLSDLMGPDWHDFQVRDGQKPSNKSSFEGKDECKSR